MSLLQQADGYLQACERAGLIRPLDRHFARRVVNRVEEHAAELRLAAAWVSHRLGQGHVCATLAEVAGKPLFPDADVPAFPAPPLESWREKLLASSVVGGPGEYRPLILDDGGRLYLHRYFEHERRAAEGIVSRSIFVREVDLAKLRVGLSRLFPDDPSLDWSQRRGVWGQKCAAALAVLRRFAVISGGPGTGKTTTVTKLLTLLIEQGGRPRIALGAPTGKAAARLTESIRAKKAELLAARQIDVATSEILPQQAVTLHRLLGGRPDSLRFRHDAETPLPVDILVIDEASMIDLPLMARLLDALLPEARLILLGDMHQLASVEAGQVFGDICGRADSPQYSAELSTVLTDLTGVSVCPGSDAVPLSDSIAMLRESFRFGQESGIGHLARAVNTGGAVKCRVLLHEGGYSDIRWQDVDLARVSRLVAEEIVPQFRVYLGAAGGDEALRAFGRFRVLCALREGPFGVTQLNDLIETELVRRRWVHAGERWYRGRPILITRNDYGLKLFNGDIGIIWNDPENGDALRAFFPGGESSAVRKLLPSRLPEHETVYAMTVHKSQGSEFDEVLLLLPDQSSPVITRELVYTGLTRARQRVQICGNRAVFESAIGKTVERSSGLAARLANSGGGCVPAGNTR